MVLLGQHNKLAIYYIPEREQLSDASTTSQLKRTRRVATPTGMQYCDCIVDLGASRLLFLNYSIKKLVVLWSHLPLMPCKLTTTNNVVSMEVCTTSVVTTT